MSAKTPRPPKALDDRVPDAELGYGALVASATNLALALELYLKALWMIQGKQPRMGKKGHALHALYQGLLADLRQELEARFDAIMSRTGTRRRVLRVLSVPRGQARGPGSLRQVETLPAILERAKDDFLVWRYLHEYSRAKKTKTRDFECLGLAIARDVLMTAAGEKLDAMFREPGSTAQPEAAPADQRRD